MLRLSCCRVVHQLATGEQRDGPHLSASSRMMILCLPAGSVTLRWAKVLILFRTTSIPLWPGCIQRVPLLLLTSHAHLSSLAFSSMTPSLYASPSKA